jgi:hypothetical protein
MKAKLMYLHFHNIGCLEKDSNGLSFLQREKESNEAFEKRVFRQLESALSCGCVNMFSTVITWSREQIPSAAFCLRFFLSLHLSF